MAHISKPDKHGNVKAVVRHVALKGRARTKTGPKEAVEKWARAVEAALDATGSSEYHNLKAVKVENILRDYRDKALPLLKASNQGRTEYTINKLVGDAPPGKEDSPKYKNRKPEWFVHLNLTQDVTEALRDFKDKSLRSKAAGGFGWAPGTTIRVLGIIASAFKWAMEEQGLKLQFNPVHAVKKPANGNTRRERVVTEDEFKLIIEATGFDPSVKPETKKARLPWMLLLARAAGWRRGEICSIQKQTRAQAQRRAEPRHRGYIDLSVPEIFFPGTQFVDGAKLGGTKNDDGFHAPMSPEAVAIIEAYLEHYPIPEQQDYEEKPPTLFDVHPETHRLNWQRLRNTLVKDHPELEGVCPHLLRHTFTTELVNAYANPVTGEVPEATKLTLLKMTGRRTIASLNHYFHPDPGALSKQMGKVLGKGNLSQFLKKKPHLKRVA